MCLFTANVLHIIYTYICTYLLQAHTAWGFCMGCDHDCLFRAAAFSWGQWIYETRCKLCLVVKHFKDVTRFVPIYMKVIYTFLLPLMFIYIYIHVSPFWIQSFCPQPCRPPIKNSKPLPQLKQHVQELCYLEFFAGQAEVFKAIRADNHPSVATDITYMMGPKNPMDILTDSGFAFKPKIFKPWNSWTVWSIYNCEVWIFNVPYKGFKA